MLISSLNNGPLSQSLEIPWSAEPFTLNGAMIFKFGRRCVGVVAGGCSSESYALLFQYALRCRKWHERLQSARKEDLRDGRKDRFSA